jgi:hypothetical protein
MITLCGQVPSVDRLKPTPKLKTRGGFGEISHGDEIRPIVRAAKPERAADFPRAPWRIVP